MQESTKRTLSLQATRCALSTFSNLVDCSSWLFILFGAIISFKHYLSKSSGSPYLLLSPMCHAHPSHTTWGPISAGWFASSADKNSWVAEDEAQAHVPFHYMAATTSKVAETDSQGESQFWLFHSNAHRGSSVRDGRAYTPSIHHSPPTLLYLLSMVIYPGSQVDETLSYSFHTIIKPIKF